MRCLLLVIVMLASWPQRAAAQADPSLAQCLETETKKRFTQEEWDNRSVRMSDAESQNYIRRTLPKTVRAQHACGLPDVNPFYLGVVEDCMAQIASRMTRPEARATCACIMDQHATNLSVADRERRTLGDMTDDEMGAFLIRIAAVNYQAMRVCIQ